MAMFISKGGCTKKTANNDINDDSNDHDHDHNEKESVDFKTGGTTVCLFVYLFIYLCCRSFVVLLLFLEETLFEVGFVLRVFPRIGETWGGVRAAGVSTEAEWVGSQMQSRVRVYIYTCMGNST